MTNVINNYIGTNLDIGNKLHIPFLHNFKVNKVIGRGGFGVVYQVEDNNNNKYALKVFPLDTDARFYKYKLEKKIYDKFTHKQPFSSKKNCVHTNISCHLNITRKCINDNYYGLILTHYYDTDLRNLLYKEKPFNKRVLNDTSNISLFISYINDLINIIQYIHNNGMYHGDIKPENILVDKNENKLVLTDFDTMCITKKKDNTCKIFDLSVPYASPKLLNNIGKDVSSNVVYESDIWAICIIVLELWFGPDRIREVLNISRFSSDFYDNIILKHNKILKNIKNIINSSINFIKSRARGNNKDNYKKVYMILYCVYKILEKLSYDNLYSNDINNLLQKIVDNISNVNN